MICPYCPNHHQIKQKNAPFKSIALQQITNVGEDVEKREPLVHCWWEYKLVQPLWKTV